MRLGADVTAARRDGARGRADHRRTASCAATRCWSPSAAGRGPADIGLDTVGLEPGEYLDVDDTLQVRGLPWLYGVGDVNGRRQLTHMGKYQARQAGAAIVARARGEEVDDRRLVAVRGHRRRTSRRRRWCSPPRRSPAWGAPPPRRRRPGCRTGSSSTRSATSPAPSLFADDYDGTAIAVVDTEREVLLGRHLHRARRRRAAAGRHDRRRRRGADQPALARRPGLPDDQRDLAAPARDLPGLTGAAHDAASVWSCTPAATARRRSARCWPGRRRTGVELVASHRRRHPARRCRAWSRSPVEELAGTCDGIIALGGDGTLLGAMRLVSARRCRCWA